MMEIFYLQFRDTLVKPREKLHGLNLTLIMQWELNDCKNTLNS